MLGIHCRIPLHLWTSLEFLSWILKDSVCNDMYSLYVNIYYIQHMYTCQMCTCRCGSVPLPHATFVAFAGVLRHKTQVDVGLKMHFFLWWPDVPVCPGLSRFQAQSPESWQISVKKNKKTNINNAPHIWIQHCLVCMRVNQAMFCFKIEFSSYSWYYDMHTIPFVVCVCLSIVSFHKIKQCHIDISYHGLNMYDQLKIDTTK